MNKDIIQGKWKQTKGEAKRQWGRLTDDDLDQVEGNSEKLAGKLQERYGMGKEEAKKEADAFLKKHESS